MINLKSKTTLVGLLLLSGLVSGCSSMGVGEAEYQCSGIPDGVRCMSAQKAYELTDGDDYQQRVHNEAMKTKAAIEGTEYVEGRASSTDRPSVTSSVKRDATIPGVVPYEVKKVLPLRTPAKVMRIAIRAWESKEGALHVPGYVYTEIEPRRWMIGEREVETSVRLTPVQVPGEGANSSSIEARDIVDPATKILSEM